MKRILFFIATTLMLASCLKDSTNKSSFPLVATFDYIDVAEDPSFKKDSIFFSKQYVDQTNQSVLGWGSYIGFFSKLNEDKTRALGGFILSSFASKEKEGSVQTPYRAADTTQIANNYLVYYQSKDISVMPERDFMFTMPDYGTCVPLVCYVTNTTEVVKAVKEKFVPGDKMVLSATGYSNGVKTGKAEIVLAESNAMRDTVMTTWSKFDLSKLGAVDNIDFEIITSQAEVPAYFCLDELCTYITLEY